MLTPEKIKELLKDRKLRIVAEATGLHYETVRRFYSGVTKQAPYFVVKKLSDYFTEAESK